MSNPGSQFKILARRPGPTSTSPVGGRAATDETQPNNNPASVVPEISSVPHEEVPQTDRTPRREDIETVADAGADRGADEPDRLQSNLSPVGPVDENGNSNRMNNGTAAPGQVDDAVRAALQNPRDRMFCLKVERECTRLILNPNLQSVEILTVSSYHRLITHRIAGFFGLNHLQSSPSPAAGALAGNLASGSSLGAEPNKRVIVLTRLPTSVIPPIQLMSLCPPQGAAAGPLSVDGGQEQPVPLQPMRIMRRARKAPNGVLQQAAAQDVEQTPSDVALLRREEEYAAARALIFGVESEQDGKQGDESVLADAPANAFGEPMAFVPPSATIHMAGADARLPEMDTIDPATIAQIQQMSLATVADDYAMQKVKAGLASSNEPYAGVADMASYKQREEEEKRRKTQELLNALTSPTSAGRNGSSVVYGEEHLYDRRSYRAGPSYMPSHPHYQAHSHAQAMAAAAQMYGMHMPVDQPGSQLPLTIDSTGPRGSPPLPLQQHMQHMQYQHMSPSADNSHGFSSMWAGRDEQQYSAEFPPVGSAASDAIGADGGGPYHMQSQIEPLRAESSLPSQSAAALQRRSQSVEPRRSQWSNIAAGPEAAPAAAPGYNPRVQPRSQAGAGRQAKGSKSAKPFKFNLHAGEFTPTGFVPAAVATATSAPAPGSVAAPVARPMAPPESSKPGTGRARGVGTEQQSAQRQRQQQAWPVRPTSAATAATAAATATAATTATATAAATATTSASVWKRPPGYQ